MKTTKNTPLASKTITFCSFQLPAVAATAPRPEYVFSRFHYPPAAATAPPRPGRGGGRGGRTIANDKKHTFGKQNHHSSFRRAGFRHFGSPPPPHPLHVWLGGGWVGGMEMGDLSCYSRVCRFSSFWWSIPSSPSWFVAGRGGLANYFLPLSAAGERRARRLAPRANYN